MKIKVLLTGFIFFVLHSYSVSGQTDLKLFERTSDSLYTFYFDSQYYLVDKDCEFFAIKRLSNYSIELKAYDGAFTDFDTEGNTLLTGTYKEGKKDGTFKAFYPTGFLKWQAEFKAGWPTKTWYFYYPDGSPMSIIELINSRPYITNTWNTRGKPVIKNRSGKFELRDPQFGFNERGYDAIVYSGKVENGLPEGLWRISYEYPKGGSEVAAIEKFINGNLAEGTMFLDHYSTYTTSKVLFAPSEPYLNAELFVSKGCNIDEHDNYTLYLSGYLSQNFNSEWLSDTTDRTIEFTLMVDKNGASSRISLIKDLGNTIANKAFLQILNSVDYWIPSQKDGKIINDVLTVSADLTTESTGKILFTNAKIKRRDGT
ncbi:hypothetical protein BDE36_0512 [Arcticibacter tournemirensis]|uniref:MORN repeat variant n=1 Tax=Arcticibacter tournemirensis TaxID=699437 RepID=A0A5M9HER5_9SPHI|nr:hypothetical protein [Arcticibacter tournemirensis]KAA8485476.1 hypothetical protein F1649_03040 [Arcticibacter tournemirensis]TQM48822.1 hypothetical protein BDE36_0512 [Arcticibacter tournemirensis]